MNDLRKPSRHALRSHRLRRRGVASVLAMMFMVLFGSLAAVMAIVAQANLRTADSFLKVNRATGAAETGLVFARRRLFKASRRFVVTKGVVDPDFGTKLWLGTYGAMDGTVTVLPPDDFVEGTPPVGIAEAIRNAHLADLHSIIVEAGDGLLPDIDGFGTIRVRPIGRLINGAPDVYVRLKYELLADGRFLRVTAQGVDGDVRRTLQLDFRMTKKIEFAVISPNRIMIGKNVRIEGPLGSRYGIAPGELDPDNGNPLVMRSDFYHLDPVLDGRLDALYAAVILYDVDGDSRLRTNHPVEANGVGGDIVDYNGDEYVDDFDLFMAFFDTNGDGMVVYDTALAFAAGLGPLPLEFDVDLQLGHLIDFAIPDRNDDDVIDGIDTALGYGDGAASTLDLYAKVSGKLAFAVAKLAWEAARGQSYQTFVQGPVYTEPDEAPVTFEISEDDLLNITTADFQNTETWMKGRALAGASFAVQVAAGLGSGGTFTPPSDATWETVPFGARGYYDWYQRGIYDGITFQNVMIPMGTNALFRNCTFVGVTYIESHVINDDPNWNFAGMVDRDAGGNMVPKYPGLQADDGAGNMIDDTRTLSNNIRFDNCTMAGSVVADAANQFTHVRNKVQFTGSTVFTLVHPDLDPLDIPELEKSSIMMPGYSVDVGNFTNNLGESVTLTGTIIAGVLDVRGSATVKGTLLMTFRPVVGEGPLFYGGTTDGFNTTIGYFGPQDGDEESVDPADLVDTDGDGIPDIGVDLDGDGVNDPFEGFGEITVRYDPDAKLPDGIPWPIVIEAEADTYIEGGTM